MSHYQWEYTMGSQRAHIVSPEELIAEIDAQVGPRGRSAFLAEVAQAELRKRKLLAILSRQEPIWKMEDQHFRGIFGRSQARGERHGAVSRNAALLSRDIYPCGARG